MQRTLSHTTQIIKLNGERVTRTYSAEVVTEINQGKQNTYNATGLEFDLTYYGKDAEGFLRYRIKVSNRFLLTKKFSIIKKLNKAQQIALRVAVINDVLEMQVNKNFKLIKVTNASEIRAKWQVIRNDLLDDFPDLHKMVDDFNWQLREENIQQLFIEDNFYTFFFSDLFYHEYKGKEPILAQKTITNALKTINIPIIEQKKISKHNISFTEVTITTNAEIDTEHPKLSLAKLNVFLGQLPTKIGDQHELHFDYKGTYKTKPDLGLVTQGKLNYIFEVKDLYKKETTLTFNLEEENE
ncbi:hypothetical protein ATE84_2819 [Aquimarina sp. MAR_2010_214]|uniref:hypothetical protein n=1 Tax=Aquimarina sp. MAR_2010_214 TaxID=1250026 RepID=UPI000C6FF937|nr:hypothetical protein [Aquimarina sp. MAR_2010_214]PKV50753.1 hypothetical protein ATE84_2819 [Aquimarina sp. MAR_2010_214]